MSKDSYIYPYGEIWYTVDEKSGDTREHRKGALNKGMTLRDHFAGLAMQGLLSADIKNRWGDEDCAKFAYQQADAMLKERGKIND